MRAGRLNQRITIQSPATGQDDYGEPNTGWTDFAANIPAEVQDLSGREFLSANAGQSVTTSKLTIRFIAGIIPTMRILHGSDIYEIKSVLRQRNVSLLLMCERSA